MVKEKGKVVLNEFSISPLIKPSPDAIFPPFLPSNFDAFHFPQLLVDQENHQFSSFSFKPHFLGFLITIFATFYQFPYRFQKMENGKNENHLVSPAAFVEGGLQEACEDSCSICLEDFCDNDPKTVTCCKHEFHIQCILEWSQRSSNCPICCQAVSLKDPSSQELLEAIAQERRVRYNPTRTSAIFHHPTLGDFEIRNLPFGFSGSELEDRIVQHLAATAAAMGSAHHVGPRNRVSIGHNQYGATMSVTGGLVQEQAEPAAVDSAGGGGTVQYLTTSGMVNGSNSQHGTSVIHRY
ncbi:putative transcription factor C2H2 family [Helianthus anomalus]